MTSRMWSNKAPLPHPMSHNPSGCSSRGALNTSLTTWSRWEKYAWWAPPDPHTLRVRSTWISASPGSVRHSHEPSPSKSSLAHRKVWVYEVVTPYAAARCKKNAPTWLSDHPRACITSDHASCNCGCNCDEARDTSSHEVMASVPKAVPNMTSHGATRAPSRWTRRRCSRLRVWPAVWSAKPPPLRTAPRRARITLRASAESGSCGRFHMPTLCSNQERPNA